MCMWTVYRSNKVYPGEISMWKTKVQENRHLNGHRPKYYKNMYVCKNMYADEKESPEKSWSASVRRGDLEWKRMGAGGFQNRIIIERGKNLKTEKKKTTIPEEETTFSE